MVSVTDSALPYAAVGGGEDIPHALYWLFGHSGAVLYIGISAEPEARLKQHEADKVWWPDVDASKTEIGWFGSWGEARAAEVAAVREHRPVHSLSGIPRHLRARGDVPEMPPWADEDLRAIALQIMEVLTRRDLPLSSARLRAVNLLLHGDDVLPHGRDLVDLAAQCGVSNRAAYDALATERNSWPEGWHADRHCTRL